MTVRPTLVSTATVTCLVALATTSVLAADKLEFKLERTVGSAINACAYPMRNVTGGRSPAEAVSMSDYLKFTSSIAEAEAAQTNIRAYDGTVLGKVVKDVLGPCEKIMKDYASGVGAKMLPVSKNCINNVAVRLKPILPGGAYQSRLTAVWFARKDLESARYRMFLHADGFKSEGATCDANDQHKEAFKQIQDQFTAAEKQVLAWEAQRGVEFHKVEDGDKIIFKKGGRALSAAESNRI